MTQYYYLVASLPLLFFDDPPPFSSQNWLEACREQVAKEDCALLERISFTQLQSGPGDHPVWETYAAWETALRNEIALQRAQRMNVSADSYLRDAPFFTILGTAVKEALNAATPKAVELALDRLRWSQLEELEAKTQFDLGRLIVYRLKLLILERKQLFRPEAGLESFREIYTQVLDSAAEWTNPDGRSDDTEKRHD